MIRRQFLRTAIKDHMAQISGKAVAFGDDKTRNTYHLGHKLGYQDGLKAALDLLEQLPAEEPQNPNERFILGRPETLMFKRSEEQLHPDYPRMTMPTYTPPDVEKE